jgi:hypothetical protein
MTKTNAKRRGEIAAEMARIGYCLPGSLVEQMRACSTPGCRCHRDPAHLHGPYRLWTRKVAGKTVTKVLTEEQYERYRSWIDNARRLHELVTELEQLGVVTMAVEQDWPEPVTAPPDRRRSRRAG